MIDTSVSAIGERAAIGGYRPQYDLFAKCIYDEIIKKNLVKISVASDKAGNLDDVNYETKKEIYAYQVKWSINEDETFSFNDFKNLFKTIFSSWDFIQKKTTKLVLPRLLTKKRLSEHDRIKDSNDRLIGSFKNFYLDILQEPPTVETQIKWHDPLMELLQLSESANDSFDNFWKVFLFIADYKEEKFDIAQMKADVRVKHVLSLHRLICQMVSSKERKVTMTYKEILKELGWEQYFNTIFNHYLYLDESQYVQISSTKNKLDTKISEIDGGYIFLEGSPGSGKSTLLSQWSQHTVNNVVTYYAFDFINPSSPDNYTRRGEAASLFHDMVLMLENLGYHTCKSCLPHDKDENRKVFYKQLDLMSVDYKNKGTKTVLIIDGLDHVTREYTDCEHQFISYLPHPDSIPQGVIIILGSQYYSNLNGLSKEIAKVYKDGNRTIMMDAFSKEETFKHISQVNNTHKYPSDTLDEIYQKSQGHPLYLNYMLRRINSVSEIAKELASMPSYDGNIETYYDRILGEILQLDSDFCKFVGLVCRLAGDIQWNFVKEWNVSENIQMKFANSIKPFLLYDECHITYSFFHNSFRQYLLSLTSRDVMTGMKDEDKYKAYYSQLADYYQNSKIESHCLAFQYLYFAGRYDDFVKYATPKEFDDEILNFRPFNEVEKDVKLGLKIGAEKKDVYILYCYWLMEAEMQMRLNSEYSALNMVEDLIQIKEYDKAKAILHSEHQLNCPADYALKYSRVFSNLGDIKEAKILFDLSYPSFLYQRNERKNSYDFRNRGNTLKEWIRTATYFLTEEDLVARIISFSKYLEEVSEKHTANYYYVVLDLERAYSLFDLENYSKLDLFIQHYIDKGDIFGYFSILRYAVNESIRKRNKKNAEKYLSQLKSQCKSLRPHLRIIVATLDWKVYNNINNIKDLIGDIDPKIVVPNQEIETETDILVFRPLYRLIFLRTLYGINDKLSTLLPYLEKADVNVVVDFERSLCNLAKIAARGLAGSSLPGDFKQLINSYIHSFNYYDDIRNIYAFSLKKYRDTFVRIIIKVASFYGEKGNEVVSKILLSYIENEKSGFPIDIKRNLILLFAAKSEDKQFWKDKLSELEKVMFKYADQTERISQCFNQGHAWFKLGEKEKGLICFKNAAKESFSVVYSKDYQPSWFAQVIAEVNQLEPSKGESRINWLAARLKHIDVVSENSDDCAEELLLTALKFNLALGQKVMKWMLDSDYLTFIEASSIFLNYFFTVVDNTEDFDAALLVYTHLFLYLEDYNNGHPSLIKELITKGRTLYGDSFEKELLPKLKHTISVQCFDSLKEIYFERIEEYINQNDKTSSDNDSINYEKDNAFYWISQGRDHLKNAAVDEAWNDAEKALSYSNPSGLLKFYDGGSLIYTLSLMTDIDADRARSIAFRRIANDLPLCDAANTMRDFDEIFPLLSADIDRVKLHENTFDYMERMLRNDDVDGDVPKFRVENDVSGIDVLIRFLVSLGDTSISAIFERVAYILAKLVHRGNSSALNLISGNPKLILNVGKFLWANHSSRIKDLAIYMEKYATSYNYTYRAYAIDILLACGKELPICPHRNLPVIYNIQFSEKRSFDFGNYQVDRDNVMSITNVVSHLRTFIYENFIEVCSEESVAYRIYELSKKYLNDEEQSEAYEKKLQAHLEHIGLKLSYIKPYAKAIMDGMFEVATDFVDAGKVSMRNLNFRFCVYDFEVLKWAIAEKPQYIHIISNEKNHYSVPEDWFTNMNQCPRLNKPLENDHGVITIGEYTLSVRGVGQRPLEEYMQQIVPDDISLNSNVFFGNSAFQSLSVNYYNLKTNEPYLIITRHSYFLHFDLKSNWIAFNPSLAIVLGWYPLSEKLFAWQNDAGELMVESIYWRKGNTYNQGILMNEVQEGWIVVATEKAIDEIKAFFNGRRLVQIKRIKHRLQSDITLKSNSIDVKENL